MGLWWPSASVHARAQRQILRLLRMERKILLFLTCFWYLFVNSKKANINLGVELFSFFENHIRDEMELFFQLCFLFPACTQLTSDLLTCCGDLLNISSQFRIHFRRLNFKIPKWILSFSLLMWFFSGHLKEGLVPASHDQREKLELTVSPEILKDFLGNSTHRDLVRGFVRLPLPFALLLLAWQADLTPY